MFYILWQVREDPAEWHFVPLSGHYFRAFKEKTDLDLRGSPGALSALYIGRCKGGVDQRRFDTRSYFRTFIFRITSCNTKVR